MISKTSALGICCRDFVIQMKVKWDLWYADEKGIETIEWVVLAAVIVVMLGALMTVLSGQANTIGSSLGKSIDNWAKSIGNSAPTK